MKCAKRVTLILVCAILALASVSAWPVIFSKTEVVEAEPVQEKLVAKAEEAAEAVSEKVSSKQGSALQNQVSAMQELLSGNSSNNKKLEAIATELENIEIGIEAMEKSYEDLKGFHVGIAPVIGYTFGSGTALEGWDIGVQGIFSYGDWYGIFGVSKAVGNLVNYKTNFKDAFKDVFASVSGLRLSLGVGYKVY